MTMVYSPNTRLLVVGPPPTYATFHTRRAGEDFWIFWREASGGKDRTEIGGVCYCLSCARPNGPFLVEMPCTRVGKANTKAKPSDVPDTATDLICLCFYVDTVLVSM